MKISKQKVVKSGGEVAVATLAVIAGVFTLKKLPTKFAPLILFIGGAVARILAKPKELQTAATIISALGGVQGLKVLLSNPDGSAKIAALTPLVQSIPSLAGIHGSNSLLLGMGDVDFDDVDSFEIPGENEFEDLDNPSLMGAEEFTELQSLK